MSVTPWFFSWDHSFRFLQPSVGFSWFVSVASSSRQIPNYFDTWHHHSKTVISLLWEVITSLQWTMNTDSLGALAFGIHRALASGIRIRSRCKGKNGLWDTDLDLKLDSDTDILYVLWPNPSPLWAQFCFILFCFHLQHRCTNQTSQGIY